MYGLLEDCQKIERLAETIYQLLASDAAYDDELRRTFRQLSRDEGAHARQIDLVRQSAVNEIKAHPAMVGERVNEALIAAEQLLQEISCNRLNEENALRRALFMEQQFVAFHAHNVLHFDNERLAALFDKLGQGDQEHIETLRSCLKWWHAGRRTAPAKE